MRHTADRFLTVPDPRLAVLRDTPRLFLAVRIHLTGETSDKKYRDQLIDLLVALRLYDIVNDIKVSGGTP